MLEVVGRMDWELIRVSFLVTGAEGGERCGVGEEGLAVREVGK